MGLKIILNLFCFSLLFSISSAQTPETINSAEIFLRLKKLNVLGTVLYIAAHPDDENSRFIAFMAKDRLYRTAYLSMTRGDGGQNLIGDDQGVDLGLIRTQELLAARRIDGAEQYFTRAFDFGYTKTTEEALQIWGKEKILSDVVWVIRKLQPDVIAVRFGEDIRFAGHGQHAAASVLAHQAFDAAADPKRFPEQFKFGVGPWQVKRLLWNSFNFGNNNTTNENQLKIDMGGYNAILGKSYGEIMAESRTLHKSQGAALTRSRGQAFEYFALVAGEKPENDIMSGVITDWRRVEGGEKIQPLVDQIIQNFSLTNPEKSVPALINLHKALKALKDGQWKEQKLIEVEQLISACGGLWLEATVSNPYVVQGDSLKVSVSVNNRLNIHATLLHVRVNGFDSLFNLGLPGNKDILFTKSIFIPNRYPITQPYWLAEEMSPGSFNVSDQRLIGLPQGKPAFEAEFIFNLDGEEFSFSRPVQYKFRDDVKGELYQPVTVLPAFTGRFDPEVIVFGNHEEKSFQVNRTVRKAGADLPELLISTSPDLQLKAGSNLQNSTINYQAKRANNEMETFNSTVTYRNHGQLDSLQELTTISYDHIPRIDYFRYARAKFVLTDIKIEGKKIGYIEGAGDKVLDALLQMGYEVSTLKEKDITESNLKQFDAIITGVRAYNIHAWLEEKHDILMNYIKDGGNLIVQYNTIGFGQPHQFKMGPYPFNIGRNRVTNELAVVNVLDPSHPVMNFPNKITAKDFDGWIQERGIYFAENTDPKYTSIFSMHDDGESDQKGSLIMASFGKGSFTYTGLVFFRELPAGVPGAYRLMANLIALNHKRGF